jgi:hypothetical protein
LFGNQVNSFYSFAVDFVIGSALSKATWTSHRSAVGPFPRGKMSGESDQSNSGIEARFQSKEATSFLDPRKEASSTPSIGEETAEIESGNITENIAYGRISAVDIDALNEKALKLREERVRVTREIASLKAKKLRSDILKENDQKKEDILRQKETVIIFD